MSKNTENLSSSPTPHPKKKNMNILNYEKFRANPNL
jgi:hypothetical protein